MHSSRFWGGKENIASLVSVFSLRWNLSSALGCISKQPDSRKTRSLPWPCDNTREVWGPVPFYPTREGEGRVPLSRFFFFFFLLTGRTGGRAVPRQLHLRPRPPRCGGNSPCGSWLPAEDAKRGGPPPTSPPILSTRPPRPPEHLPPPRGDGQGAERTGGWRGREEQGRDRSAIPPGGILPADCADPTHAGGDSQRS